MNVIKSLDFSNTKISSNECPSLPLFISKNTNIDRDISSSLTATPISTNTQHQTPIFTSNPSPTQITTPVTPMFTFNKVSTSSQHHQQQQNQ